MGSPRLLVIFALAVALVVAVVAALATGSWVVLVLALLVHFTVSAVLLGMVFKRTTDSSKPDAVTEARQEQDEAGDDDTEQARQERARRPGQTGEDRELII